MEEKIFNKNKIKELFAFPENISPQRFKKVFRWIDLSGKERFADDILSSQGYADVSG